MNRIFGTSTAKKPKPSLQDAINSTDTRIASIEVNIKKLDGELMRYKEQMNKLRNGPGKRAIEQRALRVLRQKKMYEGQLAQLAQQTFNMESAAIATENLRNTMATVEVMKLANKEMKKQYGKIDIDKIENMHYDMEDLLEQANEIQESLGRSYAVPDELDEADLEAGKFFSSCCISCRLKYLQSLTHCSSKKRRKEPHISRTSTRTQSFWTTHQSSSTSLVTRKQSSRRDKDHTLQIL
ncbi:Snf7-domain-containing protein [Butyriboletus roseoflavus]|nr:Snf7-domain-containing protein [Butyriboletus roseoflavus]